MILDSSVGVKAGDPLTPELLQTIIDEEFAKLVAAPDRIVFDDSKTTTLAIGKIAMEKFALSDVDIPWSVYLEIITLGVTDPAVAEKLIDEYIARAKQSDDAIRVTENSLFEPASSPVVDQSTVSREPASSPVLSARESNVGGIDLNPTLLDLQIKRDGKGVPLPLIQQPISTINIDGFLPVIINVTPVNLPLLLGGDFSGEEESTDLSFNSLDPMDQKGRFELNDIEEVNILN